MRLLICAGASGGGIYPALAVLRALNIKDDQMLWIGGEGGMAATLVSKEHLPFQEVPAAGLHGVGLRALPGNIAALIQGYLAARKILAEFKPDVLFFTGGYVAVPVAVAGRSIPSLIFVPDIEPGLALRLVSRFADRIAVVVAETRDYFSGHRKDLVRVTGYPVRGQLLSTGKSLGAESFDLDPKENTLLVFGGSKGARSINRALIKSLPQILAEMQVIHLSGDLDWPEVQESAAALTPSLAARYRPFPYLHDRMGAALATADLVVARAGASSLGELTAFGLPAILVPYPHAWRYQQVNADYLARAGGALIIADQDLTDQLGPTVLRVMADQDRRVYMQAAMKRLAKPEAARQIAALLESLVEGNTL